MSNSNSVNVPDTSYWVKDEFVLNCTNCNIPFTLTTRRHHCRSCGEVFCANCLNNYIILPHLFYPPTQKQKVCDFCFNRSKIFIANPDSFTKEKLLQKETLEGLKRLYKSGIKPLEVQFKHGEFCSSTILSDADFDSKPMVLLIGQYSVGKTSFIKHLLGKEFPGMRVGPEPTTDSFVIVSGINGNGADNVEQVIPGNALAVQNDRPFKSLQRFGAAFLSKLSCAETTIEPSGAGEILRHITLVDTPGILSGEKQRIGRSYDFTGVVEWFASRCDRILVVFDAHKLDISDELKDALLGLRGQDEKVRVILNKSDGVDSQQLMRVHGALMWSLGKVISTPEVVRVYVGSFWDEPLKNYEFAQLFRKEESDLIRDLKSLPHSAVIRKINEVVKRARSAKIHALLITHLKSKLPVFGKEKAVVHMMENLDKEYEEVARKYSIAMGDFPDKKVFAKQLAKVCNNDLSIFPPLNHRMIVELDEVLSSGIPRIQAQHSQRLAEQARPSEDLNFGSKTGIHNGSFPSGKQLLLTDYENALIPKIQEVDDFQEQTGGAAVSNRNWGLSSEEFIAYAHEFNDMDPTDGKLSGIELKETLSSSGLPRHVLKQIWDLADIDADGSLDVLEFSIAKHLIVDAQNSASGEDVPDKLPRRLIPPSKRHLVNQYRSN